MKERKYPSDLELNCNFCNSIFFIRKNEYDRQIKRGRSNFFCSRSCATSKSNEDNPRPGNVNYLKANNRKDDLTPFRWFILRGEYRDRKNNYGCDITTEYLKQLWEDQKGICPFTGWNLILPSNTKKAWEINSPNNASLDRINNSLGYLQGNVRFICVMANYARHIFSDEQLINFCKSVSNYF